MEHSLEVISDLVCPWCYVGKHRLSSALAMLAHRPSVRWRPFELNPGLPPEGIDRELYCRQKFGSVEHARKLYDKVANEARADGLPIDIESIRKTPNTRRAHRLVWYAEQSDRANLMVDALFNAYFACGRDIGDVETLASIAAEVGFDRTEVRELLLGEAGNAVIGEWEENASDLGVHGVPAFVFNGQYIFSGAQSPDSIRLVLERCIDKATSRPSN